jgi:conjugal transfer/type IV secretion protein DotA/TraY
MKTALTLGRAAAVLLALVATALMVFSPAAAAQEQLTNVDQVFGATRDTDASMKVFGHLIGEHLKNPFTTLGAPDTLFGVLFLTLNSFVFLIGIIFASYGIGAGIVQTAHEGQVLGKRMSAVWMPIRMVTGIAGLIPFFGGFSLAQAVMLLAALLGIGVANVGWDQVVNRFDSFSGMVRPAVGEGAPNNAPLGMAYAVFTSELCVAAHNDELAMTNADPSERLYRHSTQAGYLRAMAVLGSGKRKNSFTTQTNDYCGRVEVASTAPEKSENPSGGDRFGFGFTVNSVNYNTISNAIRNGIAPASQQMMDALSPLAQNWYRDWKSAKVKGKPAPPAPFPEIERQASIFASTIGSLGRSAMPTSSGFEQPAKEAMQKYGWFGAGAWYATLAEAQNAILEGFKSLEIKVTDVSVLIDEQKYTYSDVVADPIKALLVQVPKPSSSSSENPDTFAQMWDTPLLDISNPTGNYSLGQKLVKLAIKGGASGSGGGEFINPVIMLKNIGDYLMSSVQAFYFGSDIAQNVPALKGAKGLLAAKSALSKASDSKGVLGAVVGSLGSLFSSSAGIVGLMLGALFAMGALMSLYIPFIPFIAWMGGIIQYVTIFFEGLVAAPIWAFAHLDAEGEGMGQRSERGYVFLLNMLFRPFLMIVGFVLAAGLVVVLGTFQAILFLPAMANVQGSSLTGVASIVLLIGIFVMINITLIHGLFNLITLIPDQVLGWVGNLTGVHLGKETEDKVNALFVRMGGVMASPIKPKERREREPKQEKDKLVK